MRYCQKCGSANDDDAVYCSRCGIEISSITPAAVRKKSWLLYLLALLLLVAAGVTFLHLRNYFAEEGQDEENVLLAKADSSKGAEAGGPKSQAPKAQPPAQGTNPAAAKKDAISDLRDKVTAQGQKAISTVEGVKDKAVRTGKNVIETMDKNKIRPARDLNIPPMPDNATDIEESAKYKYVEASCDELLTDLVKKMGFSIGRQLLEVTKLPDAAEMSAGSRLREEYLSIFPEKIDTDNAWTNYVRGVGERLTAGVLRKGIEYHFHVVDMDSINAFAIPGGGVYVYMGLLKKLENEAQLSFALAHEIAHIDLRHCIALSQIMMKLPEAARNEYSFTALEMIRHPFQTEIEIDADRYALELCYRMHYSPYQAVVAWESVLADGYRIESPGLLGQIVGEVKKEFGNITQTHPATELRACKLKNLTLQLQQEAPQDKFYVGVNNYRQRVPFSQTVY